MLRFTIRDVLWLTVLVASLVAWRLDRDRLSQRGAADRKKVELYKVHKLDVVLEQIQSAPRPPAVNSVRLKLPSQFNVNVPAKPFPIMDFQLPPADRTPWIEKVEREIITREKQ